MWIPCRLIYRMVHFLNMICNRASQRIVCCAGGAGGAGGAGTGAALNCSGTGAKRPNIVC